MAPPARKLAALHNSLAYTLEVLSRYEVCKLLLTAVDSSKFAVHFHLLLLSANARVRAMAERLCQPLLLGSCRRLFRST
jgi:hypothetical protein